MVDHRGEKRSAVKVNFKRTEAGPLETYGPADIQGYGVVDGPKFEVQRLAKESPDQDRFFTLLVKGKASLYAYRDAESQDRLYLHMGDSLQELVFYHNIQVVEGKRVKVPYHEYRGTLNQAFKDCPDQMAATKKLAYKRNALTEIIAHYNQCSMPASLTYVEKPQKAKITWGVSVGATTSTLKVKGGPTPPTRDQTFSSSAGPALGLFLNTTLPWINPKLSFQGEFQYTRQRYTWSFREEVHTFVKDYQVELDLPYLKLPLQVRYTFPAKKIKPYVQGGIINSYAINYKQETTSTTSSTVVQENYSVKKEPYMQGFRKYAQSLTVGGGLLIPAWSKHQFLLEGRFEKGNGFSPYSGISSDTNQLYLLLGFIL
ncbi:hypothetical protein GCM10011405_01660 [Rufibacter glacialis]|nr:hypothetical protein GCM10011405_01660 [Rufibacter glacialis]